MKRSKADHPNARRLKLSHFIAAVAFFYLIFIMLKFREILETAPTLSEDDSTVGTAIGNDDLYVKKPSVGFIYKDTLHSQMEANESQGIPLIHPKRSLEDGGLNSQPERSMDTYSGYGRITGEIMRRLNRTKDLSVMERMVDEAWNLGLDAWEEVKNYNVNDSSLALIFEGKPESCPLWVYTSAEDMAANRVVLLPCGLNAGSSITIVGTPQYAHEEHVAQLARLVNHDGRVYVSQFIVELQGLKVEEGEAPPKILHLNPRIKGDWSRKPVIELNTCYRMQWGSSQRCDGSASGKEDAMLVDGFKRCEKWMRDDVVDSKESKTASWFKRFVGREQKPEMTWPFPFSEGKMFILNIHAGIEGYHISVGGRHVASFPYRMGFTLEDATGLLVQGDIDVHYVYATSLPNSHPSVSPQKVLEMAPKWKAQPLPTEPLRLFIGVLSAANHFAERMAVRKTWMQSPEIKSSDVVVRFFVALSPRKEVNAVLKKEASYFGDIVILPFLDRYELVVLKTIAICEYGVQNVTVEHIMKCDDDTFVRVDTVLMELMSTPKGKSLYMGNINFKHRPLRHGKWAVTYEEWPELIYPPYANGPAYFITIDIARFIVDLQDKQRLRLFKMEDVSMGMWVEQFNSSLSAVHYSHSWKYCQYGCVEGYYTAHYQSPRQMICLWNNLQKGRARCCNFR